MTLQVPILDTKQPQKRHRNISRYGCILAYTEKAGRFESSIAHHFSEKMALNGPFLFEKTIRATPAETRTRCLHLPFLKVKATSPLTHTLLKAKHVTVRVLYLK